MSDQVLRRWTIAADKCKAQAAMHTSQSAEVQAPFDK